MFFIQLSFSTHKDQAGQHMDGHNAWIEQGFQDGVFMLVGSMQNKPGGALIAQAESLQEIEDRVAQDPFVVHGVVSAEITEIKPARTDERLQFLAD